MRNTTTLVLALAFSFMFATAQSTSAALINYYTFDNGGNLGLDSVGSRNMAETELGSTSNPLAQVASVVDASGTVRNNVLRMSGRTPASASNAVNTTHGRFLSHDTTSTTILANYTVAMWVRNVTGSPGHPDNTGFFSNGPNTSSNNFQFETGVGSTPADYLQLNGRNGVVIIDGDGGGETGLGTNQWKHVAATYDGTTTRFYIDGQEFGSAAANAGTEFQVLRIGSNRGENRLYDGDIDDVGVWNNSESAVDIALIYGLGLFEGLDLDDSELDDVQSAFLAGPLGNAVAGGDTWWYGSGFATSSLGAIGGSVLGGDAFIILDDLGNGVTLTAPVVPEPSSFLLLGLGALGLVRHGRRRRLA